jgi:hypothetical protein
MERLSAQPCSHETAEPRRVTPLAAGLSMLLLVALVVQLPTLHLAAGGRHAMTDWTGLRLVAEPLVARQAKVVRRERVVPVAACLPAAGSWRLIEANAPAAIGMRAAPTLRLGLPHLLDLPPPAPLA